MHSITEEDETTKNRERAEADDKYENLGRGADLLNDF